MAVPVRAVVGSSSDPDPIGRFIPPPLHPAAQPGRYVQAANGLWYDRLGRDVPAPPVEHVEPGFPIGSTRPYPMYLMRNWPPPPGQPMPWWPMPYDQPEGQPGPDWAVGPGYAVYRPREPRPAAGLGPAPPTPYPALAMTAIVPPTLP